MARTPDQIRREKAAQETASDYVGGARATEMARAGHFRKQVDREDAAVAPPKRASVTVYEARQLNGHVITKAPTLVEVRTKADRHDPTLVTEVYRVTDGKETKVDERLRPDPSMPGWRLWQSGAPTQAKRPKAHTTKAPHGWIIDYDTMVAIRPADRFEAAATRREIQHGNPPGRFRDHQTGKMVFVEKRTQR